MGDRTRSLTAVLILPGLSCLLAVEVSALPGGRQSKSDKDIDAIGRRDIVHEKKSLNWFSVDHEKEIGKQYSVAVEQSNKGLHSTYLTEYVARIAETIARNSDVQMPVTVRLLDSEEVGAFTLPGGYQYITRGLLLRLENENELASVLARGIAHTALRSATRLMTREAWANVGSIPLIYTGSNLPPNNTSHDVIPLAMLSFRRGFELEADYFGVQYVYKAGYNPEGMIHLLERAWPATTTATALSPFPPTPDRLKALDKEIADLLPSRQGDIVSTPEFENFKQALRAWAPKATVGVKPE